MKHYTENWSINIKRKMTRNKFKVIILLWCKITEIIEKENDVRKMKPPIQNIFKKLLKILHLRQPAFSHLWFKSMIVF